MCPVFLVSLLSSLPVFAFFLSLFHCISLVLLLLLILSLVSHFPLRCLLDSFIIVIIPSHRNNNTHSLLRVIAFSYKIFFPSSSFSCPRINSSILFFSSLCWSLCFPLLCPSSLILFLIPLYSYFERKWSDMKPPLLRCHLLSRNY